MSLRKLKTRLFIVSASLGIVATASFFVNHKHAKTASGVMFAVSIFMLGHSELVIGTGQVEIEKVEKDIKAESEVLLRERADRIRGLESQIAELSPLENKVEELEQSLRLKVDELKIASNELLKVRDERNELATFNYQTAFEAVKEAYDIQVKHVDALANALKDNYPDCQEEFEDVQLEIDSYKQRYLQKLQEYNKARNSRMSFDAIFDAGFGYQARMIERSAQLRIKLFRIIVKYYERQIEEEYILLEEHDAIVEEINQEVKSQVQGIIQQQEAEKSGLRVELQNLAIEHVSLIEGTITNYQTEYQEQLDIARSAMDRIDQLNELLTEERRKLEEAKKPIMAYGDSSYAHAANDISAWYYQKGYVLDFWDWQETDIGYDIIYSIKKNPALTEQDLFKDNGKEQIAAFTNCLHGTTPKLDFNRQNSTLTLSVQLRRTAKKTPLEKVELDVSKIWVSASKFESYVSKFERVRITAGSTGGKSPTAKNLALAIMNARNGKGEIRLYDPQDGSKKDYWNMPKAGTSHEDNFAGMEEVCNLINSRRHKKSNDFVLYIFDEIDNTASSLDRNSKFRMLDLIKISIKEGSHANVGVIYIGQSADANEIPQMTHSNWNNCVGLHIGTNAGNAIEKLKSVTNEQRNNLLNQYHKIQNYCEAKNEELGLDVMTDASAYRFALVVPLSGVPKFIQLPDYDSYDYEQVMSQSAKNKGSENVEAFLEEKDRTQKLKCPKCESTRIGNKGKQFYRCLDCNKSWNKKAFTNSN